MTELAQITPGPWTAYTLDIQAKSIGQICLVTNRNVQARGPNDEELANALLIAARAVNEQRIRLAHLQNAQAR